MNLYTKVLIATMTLYFGLVLVCLYHDNRYQLYENVFFDNPHDFSSYIQRLPYSGKWSNLNCKNTTLNCDGGSVDGFFGTLYDYQSFGKPPNATLVLVAFVLDPQFYDKHYIELLLTMEQDEKRNLRPKPDGKFHVIDHQGFYSLKHTAVNATVSVLDNVFDQNITLINIDELKKERSLMKLRFESHEEINLNIELELSYAGLEMVWRLLAYAIITLIVYGFNTSASIDILFKIQTDISYSCSFSIPTVFIELCQDTLFFVLNLVLGLSMNNSTFIMLAILPTLHMCVDCMILLKCWMAQELYSNNNNNNQGNNGVNSTMARYFCMHSRLYILEIAYLYLMMRYFLDERLIFLNSFILVPQIIHNTLRKAAPDFSVNYLVCFGTLKYLLFVFIRGCPYNIPVIQYNYVWPYAGLLVIAASIFMIRLQYLYGSKAIIPQRLRPKTHEYFQKKSTLSSIPVNSSINSGASNASENAILNNSQTTNESQLESECETCSICQEGLAKTVSSVDANSLADLIKSAFLKNVLKRNFKSCFMKTPCSHKFHCECLISWMEVKMICPICRANLPPIE